MKTKSNRKDYLKTIFQKYLEYRAEAKNHRIICDNAFAKLDRYYLNNRVQTCNNGLIGTYFNWADHPQDKLDLLNDYNEKADIVDKHTRLLGLFEHLLSHYRPFMDLMDKESFERKNNLLDKR